MSCSSEKSALRATTVFACLYVLSGAFITSVGIYALHRLPELFTTGSVIWSGIIVSGLGVTAMLFACRGTVSFRKGMILVVIASVILIVCVTNIVLLETVEWKYGVPPLPVEDPEEERRREFLFFLTCLFSLFGTVLGLITSVCNLFYAYCILLIPMKQLEKKRDIMKEKVKLHQSIKKRSPTRGIPDGNTISKPPPSPSTSLEQTKSSALPKSMPEEHHGWVYDDHEISSENSVSSEGTEMVANKAFLRETLDTPPLLHLPSVKEQPVSVTTKHQENQEVLEVVDDEYPWQRRRPDSTFHVDPELDQDQPTSELDVVEIGVNRDKARSFQLSNSSKDDKDVEDVHTVFNQLDRAVNAILSPGEENSAESSKLDETTTDGSFPVSTAAEPYLLPPPPPDLSTPPPQQPEPDLPPPPPPPEPDLSTPRPSESELPRPLDVPPPPTPGFPPPPEVIIEDLMAQITSTRL